VKVTSSFSFLRRRHSSRWLTLALALGAAVLLLHSHANVMTHSSAVRSPNHLQDTFTPAHSSVWEAVQDFIGWRTEPVQPIAFTHKKHAENQVECTACHQGVTKGPVAGLPSLRVCMRCHAFFAKDRPEIQKLTSIFNAGQDVSWQRVYGFSTSAHVKFNHAPHIQSQIECSTCHGNVPNMTVAVRAVNINMGFCLGCHRFKRVSTDCETCHY